MTITDLLLDLPALASGAIFRKFTLWTIIYIIFFYTLGRVIVGGKHHRKYKVRILVMIILTTLAAFLTGHWITGVCGVFTIGWWWTTVNEKSTYWNKDTNWWETK